MRTFKLKLCPFCGSEATVWGSVGHEHYTVVCDNEQCGCSYGSNMQLDFDEVIKMWNTRAESEDKHGKVRL